MVIYVGHMRTDFAARQEDPVESLPLKANPSEGMLPNFFSKCSRIPFKKIDFSNFTKLIIKVYNIDSS